METFTKILWWPELYLWIGFIVAIGFRITCRQKGKISEWILAIVFWPIIVCQGLKWIWDKIKDFKI